MNGEADNFLKNIVLKQDRNIFFFQILLRVAGYIGFTLWLNSIRTTAPMWIVWILIFIQFAFYFSIFIISHQYSKICGLNKTFSYILFITLAILGRVNDWELFIIPSLVITMIFCAIKNKNLSERSKHILEESTKP